MTVQVFLARKRIQAAFAAMRREREVRGVTEVPRAELRQEHVEQEGRRLPEVTPCRDAVTDLLRGGGT